ncbi:uncharacterized protein LOC123262355 [Cotesia glomerata]|uniref:uncharacterized protein LOC123262355 n=1 Tax=Cotesia glomerata TaxID=32391 RepID=UPI001D021E12|nr:uncharacterized protein LOC123262355 [Cotesia glomerata]
MRFPGSTDSSGPPYLSRGAVSKALYLRQHSVNQPQSPAIRPEDLSVTPWFTTTANTTTTTIDDSITDSTQCLDRALEASSYPSSSSFSRNNFSSLPPGARPELVSTRGSSIDSDNPPIRPPAPRKAYMDLSDAIALLDETCPNPDASPSLTPRTPRTPLNANSRNKRARSKSSDNSSNYSSERLSDRSSTTDGYKEKRRPFLQKIGISKTEDRPFLSKITPKIIGKPYLEKIGPSKALERPFLDKIGSSKTLDKFNFESLRELPRAMIRRTQTIVEPSIERTREEPCKDVILVVEEEELVEEQVNHSHSIDRNRKSLLLKMYSFETEDLDEHGSIDIIQETGPSSLPPLDNDTCCQPNNVQNSQEIQKNSRTGAELIKCRVTTSEEIVSSVGYLGSPRTASSWSNSPFSSGKKERPSPCLSRLLDRNYSSREMSISDEEAALIVPNSPTKRRISKVSPEPQLPVRVVPSKGKNSSLPRDLDASPTKTRRQASEDILPESNGNNQEFGSFDDKTRSAELIASKSRRQTFNETIEKFGGRSTDYRTKRQISEDILDKTDKKDCYGQLINERRGISSDNLIYSRETVVGSAPSASSLGYQSGSDSPFANSHPSSNNSQDMLRGTFKVLHDKFELQDVPAESYAAFKRRTRMTTTSSAVISTDFPIVTERYKFVAKETTIGPVVQVGKVYDITSNKVSKVKEVSGNKDDDKDNKGSFSSSNTVKSVLKKQDRIDSTNDREADVAGSLIRRPVRRIFHEPSQETMDLLTELKRIKSLLKTPSEEGKDWELDCLKPARLPKKISLSDKEFCLSVERENSIRRSSVFLRIGKGKKEKKKDDDDDANNEESCFKKPEPESGPALFEKRCLSLDYADDVKPIKPEARAISLASEWTDEKDEGNYIDPGNLICECDCDFSDVFEENSKKKNQEKKLENCLDVDIAIPVDQSGSVSPKRREKIQGRTSDLYEIISPRSTPFRVKKRLGRISVEDGVKPESFTIDKVDCRSVVTQKKTKCFPL